MSTQAHTVTVDGIERVVDARTAFFFDHAGWSYVATETSDQGRLRCAQSLANAELHAEREGWSVQWSDDWSIGMSHARFYSAEAYPDGDPTTCQCAVLVDAAGEALASLGCVDDATDSYRRVVAAELASVVS